MASRHCENSTSVSSTSSWKVLYQAVDLYGPLVWAIAATLDMSKWTLDTLKPNFIHKKFLACDIPAFQLMITYEIKCEHPHTKLGPKNPWYNKQL